MQDQDPHSKNWGNLRWCWRDAGVTDTNAVEFCMQDALLIHIRHGDWLPPEAKKELADLLRLGVEGCLRHRVPTDYTNIAILNAGNLIVLGERLDRADAAREGYRRLDAICLRTAAFGVHEFCSPTYYGTDLNGLLLIHTYAQGKRQRQQAEALLQLFWTDIAANWFPAAQRLGGCHSRSYDYLRGLGGLDWHLWIHGWLESQSAGSAERREPWTDEWSPPPSLVEMGRRQFPRWVRQHWGILPAESRSQMLYRDIALSCCGAGYGYAGFDAGGRSARRPRTAALLLHSRRPRGSLWKEEIRNGFRPAPQGPAHAAVLGRGATVVRCLGAGDLSRSGPGGCGSRCTCKAISCSAAPTTSGSTASR